jgi:1-pyrroline-5-carboxylate dehydrogenase|eukprot:SAG25_NODE_650_length_6188_cov_4.455740_12_plen_143_part_00
MFSRTLSRRPAPLAATPRRFFQRGALPAWATVDPWEMSGANPQQGANLVAGEWTQAEKQMAVIDPLNGEEMLLVPDTSEAELAPFIASMHAVPKSGLHNSLKDPGQFFELGEVNGRASIELRKPEVANFFGALPRSPHPPGI